MTTALYYGSPQEQWDSLLLKAEDLLRDENLGNHIVGAFPAGSRLYGLESAPEEIMCLYVDSAESLINPASHPSETVGFHIYTVGNLCQLVYLVDLYSWARWLIKRGPGVVIYYDSKYAKLMHLLPFGDTFHTDSSISDILEAAQQLQAIQGYPLPDNDPPSLSQAQEYYLYTRTMAILSITGKFYPCINPKWDNVFNIQNIPSIDTALPLIDGAYQDYLLGKNDKAINIKPLTDFFRSCIRTRLQVTPEDRCLSAELGQQVANFYRFML